MHTILFAAGAILLTVLIILVALTPPRFKVERSAVIGAPPERVFRHVNDFHLWQAWSPWAKIDPEAKIAFIGPDAGKGAEFTWNGNKSVGEGRMSIVDATPPQTIRLKLDFVRPMVSTANVTFLFEPAGDGTKVTWRMSGESSFVHRLMCLVVSMDKMVGGDYERGLANLKSIVEGETRRAG